MRPKWTAQQIELAIMDHFNTRINLIVCNVSWGLFKYHEADLVIVSKSDWGTEVEIKVSAQDIKKDLLKRHKHKEALIKDVWFAVPEELSLDPNIPDYAGILSVSRYKWGKKTKYRVTRIRLPKKNIKARKFTKEERLKLLRLGCLRIEGLKRKLDEKSTIIDKLKEELKNRK